MPIKPCRFLDPKTDIVFKRIFGENKDLVKSFLNSVLPLEEDQLIDTLEYLTPEQTPRIPSLKNTIVDVKCQDSKGRIFIVEMQLQWSDSFAKRLQFGACKAYVQQLTKGDDYKSLYPVYALGIINAVFDHTTPEWYHHYKTVNVGDPNRVLEGLQLVFIELPKFKPTTWNDRKLGVLWLRFLKELDEDMHDMPQGFDDNPELLKAMELSQESSYSKPELEAYDKYWDAVRVESTIQRDAYSKGIEEGVEAGIEIGREEGREEGELIGIEKGRSEGERQAKFETARNLKVMMLTFEQISAATGLSLEDLKNL